MVSRTHRARKDLLPIMLVLDLTEILLPRPKWIRTHQVSLMANRILNQISRDSKNSTVKNVSGLQRREFPCPIRETTNKIIRLWLSSSTISRATRFSTTGECLHIEKILKTSEHYDLKYFNACSGKRNINSREKRKWNDKNIQNYI